MYSNGCVNGPVVPDERVGGGIGHRDEVDRHGLVQGQLHVRVQRQLHVRVELHGRGRVVQYRGRS